MQKSKMGPFSKCVHKPGTRAGYRGCMPRGRSGFVSYRLGYSHERFMANQLTVRLLLKAECIADRGS
jgi:hypothetical protein